MRTGAILAAIVTVMLAANCTPEKVPEKKPAPEEFAPAPTPTTPRMLDIQEPLKAGQFYPGDPNELRNMVRGYLDQAPAQEGLRGIAGLMSPHAGLVYSGPVAAHAYKTLAASGRKKVVIMGPSHRAPLQGVFVLVKDGYRTPLGVVKLDRERSAKLAAARPWITSDGRWYSDEHSIEVQLPFLQEAVGPELEATVIMIGSIRPEQCAELAASLSEIYAEDDVVFIASTDMSHGNYPPYKSSDQIRPVDQHTLEVISKMDPAELARGLADDSTPLCGGLPVLTLLHLMKLRGVGEAKVLGYADSGDATGSHEAVVGYGAVAFIQSQPKSEGTDMGEKKPGASGTGMTLSDAEKIELLKMARASAEAAVKGGKIPRMETAFDNLKRIGAAFVTLKNRGQLRGCIGTIFADEPLYQCVQHRAVDAAVNDSRFFRNRVTPGELPAVEIEISVLTPPVAATPDEIVVGRDGVFLTVGHYRGVFLPQVPVEQRWNHDEYLDNLCFKAGMDDPACWRRKDAKLERFEAIVFSEKEMGL